MPSLRAPGTAATRRGPRLDGLETRPTRVAGYGGLLQADKLSRAALGYRVFSRLDHRDRLEIVVEYWCYYVYNEFTVRGTWLPYRVRDNHPHDLERLYLVLTPTEAASASDAHDGSIPPNQYDSPASLTHPHSSSVGAISETSDIAVRQTLPANSSPCCQSAAPSLKPRSGARTPSMPQGTCADRSSGGQLIGSVPGVRAPRRIQVAMTRGFQTHDGEMALGSMVKNLAEGEFVDPVGLRPASSLSGR